MMNWLYYLLEANLYLAVFYGFYRLFLHKETFCELNRYYLIATTVIAFILPLLQIGYLNQILSSYYQQNLVYIDPKLTDIKVNKSDIFDIELLIPGIYVITATAFFLRLGYNLYGVLRLALTAKKRRYGNIIYIELNNSQTAFSFFNLLFVNPVIEEKQTILKHEMVHIKQKHSLDILFFEIVQILNWFNPVSFLIKEDIKLLHEYIADHNTTKSDVPKHDYAMFLIQNSFGSTPYKLTSQIFNQSILKRRINMLNKERSAGRTRLRLLFALPIAGGMLCASTMAFTKEYAVIDLYALKDQPQILPVQKVFQQEKKYFFIKDSEKRLLVLNGKKLDRKGIITIESFDKMVELNGKAATEKYGSTGANGAVEFTGAATKASTKFPPPIVTKDVPPPPPPVPPVDVKLTPPPPPPAPPKPKAKSTALKFEGKHTKEESIEALEDVRELKAVNADMEGIKQVKINANKDKNAKTTFSYNIVAKPDKELEKVKSDVKEIKIDYVEKEKDAVKPVKKD